MNTAPPSPALAARAPSLYEGIAQLERHFGAALVSSCRWGTADGTIEYKQAYGYLGLLGMQRADERLHLARAMTLRHDQKAAQHDERVAHGCA